MKDILKLLRKELKANTDERTKEIAQGYSKEKLKFYGVKSPVAVKIGMGFFKHHLNTAKKEDIFNLCEDLWESGYIEESFIACNWAYSLKKHFEEKDFKIFERWLQNYVYNWASCDTLCNHTIGDFVMMYPEYIKELKKWAKSENRWLKRGAAVTLIIPARKGLFLNDIFEIADILLLDKDDLVQKGYGWMLKSASEGSKNAQINKTGFITKATAQTDKTSQKAVFDYIMKNKAVMPRTALRYAIEKMPQELKKKAMGK